MTEELILHEYHASGNCYKIRLAASLLSVPFKVLKEYDVLKGETRTETYLQTINPNGRIPVLQIGQSTFLCESSAILFYLASGATMPSGPSLIPEDRLQHAQMLQWMFFEQYSVEPYVGTLRFWLRFIGDANLTETKRSDIPAKKEQAEHGLGVMESHLKGRKWFVGDQVSLADVALFGYVHAADEAGLEMGKWPGVKSWIERVKGLEGFKNLEA